MKGLNSEIYTPAETMFMKNDIALIDSLNYTKESAIIIDNGLIVGFCLKGKGSFKLNNKIYNISPNNLIICPPKVIINSGLISLDFEWRIFIISSRIIDLMSVLTASESWNLIQIIDKYPIWQLDSQKIKLFLLYYDLIKMHLSDLSTYHYQEARLLSIIQAFIYDLHQTLLCKIPNLQHDGKQEHYLFSEFLKILSKSHPCNRKISYYANMLNTTSKYLTYICKQQCGKTASEIINQHMIKDIVRLLRDSNKSIKEISNELEFPNLSFFGTYVRHHLKMSPTEYRNKLLKKNITNKNQ